MPTVNDQAIPIAFGYCAEVHCTGGGKAEGSRCRARCAQRDDHIPRQDSCKNKKASGQKIFHPGAETAREREDRTKGKERLLW